MPYKVEAIQNIAKEYNIPIVEDSAEALGSTYMDRACGTFGDIGVLSFNGNKIITTSGGGALVSKNKEYTDTAIFLATQARDDAPHYQHSQVGYNYRMSNVLAGIGRGQMEVLQNRVDSRRANFAFYEHTLGTLEEIEFLSEPKGYYSNRWLSCILTPSFEMRERIRLALLDENIESRPLWKPLHLQPIFKQYKQFTNGTSETLFDCGLCLPSGSNLGRSDLERVADCIKKILS
jgi:dTDP-4-amino-4,6-dideoxygalactose transaminase